MRWSTKLRFWLAGLSAKAGGLSIVPGWVDHSFLEPSWDRLVGEGLTRNSAFFACVGALAFSFPEPPLLPYSKEGEEGDALLDHPLRLLLRRPNPLMGERELFSTTMTYLAVGGNAYWHKVRNSRGQVIRLWPYHSGQITAAPGGDDWIRHYIYSSGGGLEEKVVPVEDIVHFKWPIIDPSQPWQALPPLVAAAQEVDMDNEARRYVYALLKNDAVPRVALEMPEHVVINDEMERRLKSQWRQKYGGDNRGDVAIITGGAKVSRVSLNMQELAYEALSRVPEARIAAALRVPTIVAGLNVGLERSTYANYKEARTAFTEDTLVPLWEIVAGEVYSSLAPEYGNAGLDVRFDTSKVKALQENTDALWKRVNEAARSGLLKVNEARSALGYDQQPEGDAYLWELNQSLMLGSGPVAETTPSKSLPRLALPKGAQKASPRANARRLQRIRLAVIEEMADAIEGYFEKLSGLIVERAGGDGKAKGKGGSQKADGLPTLEELFDPEDEKELAALFRQFYGEIVQASWLAWGEMLDDDTPFNLTNPAVRPLLERSSDNVKEITETTRQAIRDVLVNGRAEGWSIQQLVEGVGDLPGLRSVVTETYKGRAHTIARTELGTAQNQAAVGRYQAAGVKRVRVLDNGFDNSDPRCTELDGTVQTLAWAEANPLQHPNCVRAFAAEFEE